MKGEQGDQTKREWTPGQEVRKSRLKLPCVVQRQGAGRCWNGPGKGEKGVGLKSGTVVPGCLLYSDLSRRRYSEDYLHEPVVGATGSEEYLDTPHGLSLIQEVPKHGKISA